MDYLQMAIDEVAETLGNLDSSFEHTESDLVKATIVERQKVYGVIMDALIEKKVRSKGDSTRNV